MRSAERINPQGFARRRFRRLGNDRPQQPACAAAEFEFKLGLNTPGTHPITLRVIEAARAIGTQSSGCCFLNPGQSGGRGQMPEETVPVRGCYPFSQGCRISQPDLDVAWLFGVFPLRVGAGKGVKIACLAPLVALR
jgi:hypothetical protein